MARYEGLLAEILEGIDVVPHEGSHVGSQDESHVDGPGLAQHHHEGPDPVLAAILVNAGEAAPVHLGLLSRRGFNAYRGLGGVVKRVCSRSSLPGVGRWPSTTPFSWHNGSPLRATA